MLARPASLLKLAKLRQEYVVQHPQTYPDKCTYISNLYAMLKNGGDNVRHIFDQETLSWWRRYLRGLSEWVAEERSRIALEAEGIQEWPVLEGRIRR